MKKFLVGLCIAVLAALLLLGCKKEKDPISSETPTSQLSNAKRIMTFRFIDLDVVAEINHQRKTVTATVPYGTNIRALAPEITVSPNATVSPASGVMVDFTNPVTYTVTAEDGSQAVYTATITVEEPAASDQPFVGTWGVEKIEYYQTDYAGNPIAASMETYLFDPYDTNNGIHLIFRENKTGEMRDSSVDTVWTDWNEQTQMYESYIVNPDTVLVTTYTYSYDESEYVLYMNMVNGRTFRMEINELTQESFYYVNVYAVSQYNEQYVEKAYLRRFSYAPIGTEKPAGSRTIKTGSLFGKR